MQHAITEADARATVSASAVEICAENKIIARAQEKRAALVEKLAAAQAAAATPAPADPAAPASASPAAEPPKKYIQEARDKLAAHNQKYTPDSRVTAGIEAHDKLTASGSWEKMKSDVKRSNITPEEQRLLLKVQEGAEAGGITIKTSSALRKYLDDLRAGQIDLIQAPPSTPVGVPRVASPLPSPGTPVPTPQTGSGLEASEVPAWKLGAARAMDLAETGDQVGALRLLTKYAATMPEDKMSEVYAFVLAHHVKFANRD